MPEVTHAVEVEDLHKSYGATRAVAGVSFTVGEGEIFGILGPNGAGKTTTVECIEGLTKPDLGRISVLGLDPARDRAELRRVMGVQLQQSNLPEKLRVREALHLYSSFYRDPEPVDALLERVGLDDKRKTFFGDLSGGQQQRLSIALALVGRPRIAILDELTSGLDPAARRAIWGLIRDLRGQGVTVMLVTHLMEEAEQLCDRLALLDRGKVLALDSPAGLIARTEDRQVVEFQASAAVPAGRLEALPDVLEVLSDGDLTRVVGQRDVLHSVTGLLHELGVRPVGLRLRQTTLEDAYLRLTGRPYENPDEEASA
ncbi:MAG: ABC transporter ATP-binding protein [Kineosporiaceae bacterium]